MLILKLKTYIFILITSIGYGQNTANINEYYSLFDKVVDQKNTGLNNGIVYKELFRTLQGNHQFSNPKFQLGSVNYDNQKYSNVLLKYDVYSDNLIVKLANEVGDDQIILVKSKIESFIIKGHYFIKSPFGFIALVYQNKSMKILKKHKKTHHEKIKRNNLYSVFKSQYKHILIYNNEYYILKNKKSIISIFPLLKKEIIEFYRNNKLTFKSNPDYFYTNLFKNINNNLK